MMYYTSSDEEPDLKSLDISNDQYYRPSLLPLNRIVPKLKSKESSYVPNYGSKTIRHSLPAHDLWKPFFPTYLSEEKFRHYHRPRLRHFNTGPQSRNRHGRYGEVPIKSLSRHIFREHKKLKNKIMDAISQGLSVDEIVHKHLLIKEAKDLSAKSGELFLFEYCEEYPPVLGQIGMASNIKTYSFEATQKDSIRKAKVKTSDESNTQMVESEHRFVETNSDCKYGYSELIKSDKHAKQIYFNPLKPGSTMQVIENNLYRAPIFEHEVSECDFLLIRTRNSVYIRPLQTIFAVGQLLPLSTVPCPTEAQIQKFRCDLSNVYIHKLFRASDTDPPSIKLDVLCKAFPDYHRSILQKRMKNCGAKQVTLGCDTLLVQAASNYGKVTLDEIRRMLRPEHYCLNMSMLAARQRLRELNYTESMIYPPKEVHELEREVLAAPWNTSRAVISAMKGQAYLDLEKHIIDPTGSLHEGFSCVPWVKSPTEEQQIKETISSRTNVNVNRSKIALPLEKNPLRAKITQEKLRRLAIYQREAQHIADIQSEILSDRRQISSSEDEDDLGDESENQLDGEFNRQLEDLNRLVIDGRSIGELNYEREEEERHKMLSEFYVSEMKNRKPDNSNPEGVTTQTIRDDINLSSVKNKVLIITRTYDHGGSKIRRTEIVREPSIIVSYVKQKGGTLDCTVNESNQQPHSDDKNKLSIMSNKSDSVSLQNQSRPRGSSLGPTELCRAEGTFLRISKKVLEHCRPTRTCRR